MYILTEMRWTGAALSISEFSEGSRRGERGGRRRVVGSMGGHEGGASETNIEVLISRDKPWLPLHRTMRFKVQGSIKEDPASDADHTLLTTDAIYEHTHAQLGINSSRMMMFMGGLKH